MGYDLKYLVQTNRNNDGEVYVSFLQKWENGCVFILVNVMFCYLYF